MPTHKPKILVVDDSPIERLVVESALGGDYSVVVAGSAEEAFTLLAQNRFDLIILDVMLPGADGYEICSQVRANPATVKLPIVFVTSRKTLPDQLTAFSLGADDFISKPVNGLELKARVQAKLRHLSQNAGSQAIVHGELSVDPLSRRVSVAGKAVQLTRHEFDLLHYLASHKEQVVSRQQILDVVWGSDMHVSDRTVDSHISKLRRKLGAVGQSIESVHGSGYRFAAISEKNKVA